MTEYRHKKEKLARAQADEVRQHNQDIENIAFTTATVKIDKIVSKLVSLQKQQIWKMKICWNSNYNGK
jgi:hypothetical protein